MSYGIKYRVEYLRKSGGQTTIDILERDHADYNPITDLKAVGDPLEISLDGNIDNIYIPTIGSGCTIKVRTTPLTMLSLFTDDPQKFKVQIWNGVSGSTLVWQGFVNTEIFSESYSTPLSLKGEFTIYCNDGMAVLENISYRIAEEDDSSGIPLIYDGDVTIAEVLFNIFSKLNLVFTTIRTASDLLVKAAKSNLFLYLTVNNENYYDEEGKAMSCREVLNSIFGGLGLVMFFKGNTIYLIDPINLHDKTLGKVYTLTNDELFCGSETQSDLGGYLHIIEAKLTPAADELAWYETGAVLDIVKQFNQLEIKYDPYTFVESGYAFDEIGHASNTYAREQFTDNNIIYRIFTGVLMKDWLLNGGVSFEGIQEVNTLDDAAIAYYIKQLTGGTGSYEYFFPYSNIKQDENSMLELSMSVYVNTRPVDNIISPAATIGSFQVKTATEIKTLYVGDVELKVGDNWYNEITGQWEASQHKIKMYVRQLEADIIEAHTGQGTWWRRTFGKLIKYVEVDTSIINDTWITTILPIPLKAANTIAVGLLNGSISIIISKVISLGNILPVLTGGADTRTFIKNILIKDVSIQVVDLNKKPVLKDGILTKANISDIIDRKKAPLIMDLTSGIGPYGSSKGAFSSTESVPAGTIISGLMRAGAITTVYKTSDLVAQNLLSQYKEQRFMLIGKLNVKDFLLDVNMKLIQDSNHLANKSFYIVGGIYNDKEESMKVDMIELESTRELIELAAAPPVPPTVTVYDDWFLPSLDELEAMYTRLKLNNLGGFFTDNYYWCSTEYNNYQAQIQDFITGFQTRLTKARPLYIRAARKFDAAYDAYIWGDVGPAGGLIFAIVNTVPFTTNTYYECSPSNLSKLGWSNIDATSCPGAEGTAIGTGTQNTLDIIAQHGAGGSSAAKECANYSVSVLTP